ncbi:MAG: hypothetical protein J2P25_07300 [Nocardiopsaceae bacterium]|nr:hypothetical protein [Nocardiopsaceae bacterium]
MTGRPTAGDGTRGPMVYLLHLDPPYRHARHYLGWTENLPARLAEHWAGTGARLLAVAREAGGSWHLARTWPGTRTLERALKDMRETPRLCPECTPRPLPLSRGRAARLLAAHAALEPEPAARQVLPGPVAARGSRPQASAVPDVVPEPGHWPEPGFPVWRAPRELEPSAVRELMPVVDELTAGWQAEAEAEATP